MRKHPQQGHITLAKTTVAGRGVAELVWLQTLKEKAMAPHSSTLAWKIPGMEEPSRLQSVGS